MSGGGRALRRPLLAPEVIQTSAMDCGPAALTCLLAGFGLHVHYGRLREACQTSVDGTSIDSLEEIARMLGLDAEQVLVPVEHLLVPEAELLPAIAILRLPGSNHVVVVWRRVGGWVQIMDPGVGRRWLRVSELVRELYVHEHELPASDWREWAGAEQQRRVLQARLRQLGAKNASELVAWAEADPTWRSYAALDAAIRLVHSLVDAGVLARGARAVSLVQEVAAGAARGAPASADTIPERFWSVQPSSESEGENLVMRGTVLLTVNGRRGAERSEQEDAHDEPSPPVSSDVAAAIQQPQERPARELWRMIREEGLLRPLALAASILLAAAGVMVEALLFRVLLDVESELALSWQRLGALGALAVLLGALLVFEFLITHGLTRMGRHLEARFRVMFLRKLPRLGVEYFHSRLISDMATRCHSIDTLRALPFLAGIILQTLAKAVLTTAAIVWLYPSSGVWAIGLAITAIALPLLFQSTVGELEMRVRIHSAALSRCYLDSLLGLFAIRAHNAERTIRREHEAMLVPWSRAVRALNRLEVGIDGVQALLGFGLAVALLGSYLAEAPGVPGTLLLAYWALQLPVLGQLLAAKVREYPVHRNATLRMLEPCNAPEQEAETVSPELGQASTHAQARTGAGLAIELEDVQVRAGGHFILSGVNLSIKAGSHVAIVGKSGSGKSTLVGILLGWHRAVSGQVRVEGQPLEEYGLSRLREQTAWIDPTVQLWNRSVLENLTYGMPVGEPPDIPQVLDGAQLHSILESLPDGLQTELGDSGGLLSGGQAQRVRVGRAMLRPNARLVILDEPFRGLERPRRRELLQRVRRWWPHATLLSISHDVSDTLGFERVLVMDGGRVHEDGAPEALAAQQDSLYATLLAGEQRVDREIWGDTRWRRLWLRKGSVASSQETRG